MTLYADSPAFASAALGQASVATSAPAIAHGERVVRFAPKYASNGGMRDVRVRFALHGAPCAPLVVVQGGISADRHAATADGRGWWQAQIGPGRAIDSERFRVLSLDWLDRSDLTGAHAVGAEDQADALAALLTTLGIDHVHAYIGASYGAMAGLAFAARHPQRVRRLILIAAAHRAHPYSVALRSVQREIVRMAQRLGDGSAGLDLARRLAMTTYRSEREFAQRFSSAPAFADGHFHFAADEWLRNAGERFVARFSAERFLALSESIDLHDIAPEDVHVPATLIGITSDRVTPLADMCELQRRYGAPATLHAIDSPYGHDAFLKEEQQIGALLREVLHSNADHP
jgi:homoserine O-acetyltransferase